MERGTPSAVWNTLIDIWDFVNYYSLIRYYQISSCVYFWKLVEKPAYDQMHYICWSIIHVRILCSIILLYIYIYILKDENYFSIFWNKLFALNSKMFTELCNVRIAFLFFVFCIDKRQRACLTCFCSISHNFVIDYSKSYKISFLKNPIRYNRCTIDHGIPVNQTSS